MKNYKSLLLVPGISFLLINLTGISHQTSCFAQKGIAAQYPGDVGIEKHPSVVFVENFETGSMNHILEKWTSSQGAEDHRLTLDSTTGPEGSAGNKSLKMTILRNKEGEASELRKIFEEGYEQLYFRFYAKFADDFGFCSHFTCMWGDVNPTPWPKGGAGLRKEDVFNVTIDQSTVNRYQPGDEYTPPGYWMFYSYWPEMRSWQTPQGEPDGRPNPYYGNVFMPKEPVVVKRGEWQCIEMMIRMNSAPDKKDGAQAFWINGILVGSWDPKEENPVRGYWMRDVFYHDPDHKDAKPFPGFAWRPNPDYFERLKINILLLQNYVSEGSFVLADKYAAEHPDFKINLEEATVWKDHIVVATEYIGPIGKK